MQAIWNRIETQLQILAPSIRQSLRSGASEATLHQAETFLSITLPEEVKALYLIHNGQGDRTYRGESTGIVDGWHFFSLKSMCYAWLIARNDLGLPGSSYNHYFACPTQERYPAYWHPHWLHFMGHWMGPKYCIDLAPGPNGKMGQILFYNDRHKSYPDPLSPGRPSIRVVASSIEEFFTNLANDLEAGVYTFDEATGMLWSKEMLSAMSATEATIFGRKEDGNFWTDNQLGASKREREKWRRLAFPVQEGPDWDDLFREHPDWDTEPLILDESPDNPF